MGVALSSNYQVRLGSPLDRALLLQFARRTYREIEPERSGESLPMMIDRYLSRTTPIWWIEDHGDEDYGDEGQSKTHPVTSPAPASTRPLPHIATQTPTHSPIACLWLGSSVATDNAPRAHVLLIYVAPTYRRQGLATYLLAQAEAWAKQRGDRGIGLQVMAHNQAAIALYQKLGFTTLSQWMNKPFDPA